MPDVIQYNGQDEWKKKATELLNQGGGGGGGGLVDDVIVYDENHPTGQSVVNVDKEAEIDLTSYAKTSDIPDPQVQSDYAQSDSSAVDYIKNKPTIPSTAEDVGAIPATEKGANSGVATLDSTGKVPSSQLPTISNYTATGNIDISQQNVISRKEVWLDSFAEYEALQNADSNTDYHVPSVTFGLLPITVVNGKICCHYKKEV